jgi:small conductance mechanosensitive channel
MYQYINVITELPDTMDVINGVQEGIQEVSENPGIIRSWLEGLVPDLLSFALQVVLAIVIYIVGAKLIKWLRKLLKRSMERRNADVGLTQFLSAMIKYSLHFVLIMVILNMFGIATTSVVAVLGSAGVAAGLALQGSLSNFAGGVLILLLKPFRVGDYIVQGSNEGTVYEISIFYTKLRTADNRMIVIPNGELSNSSLTNVSHLDKRRIDIIVGISYDADIREAKRVLFEMAQNDEARIPEEDAVIFVNELAESSVNLNIRVWVKSENYWSAKWRLTENAKYVLDSNNITIPFKQIDIQIKQ